MNELIDKLLKLKKERNAVILAHFYQDGIIQDVADFLGDSLALSQQAKKTGADVILFCGVHFMAETAKILNPAKKVLIPDMSAGCSLADAAPADKFRDWVESHPGHTIISYINCSAEVKAMSDIICTSSNAVKIVRSLPENAKICFAPDKYLGAHVIKQTGRDMVLWDGSCQVHEFFSEMDLINLMHRHPEAMVAAHPECPDNLLQYADYIGSTTGIIKYTVNDTANEFIILTEPGIIHNIQKRSPDKKFYTVSNIDGCSCNECPYMRLNTIEKMIQALETMQPEIILPDSIMTGALKPLEKMLELS